MKPPASIPVITSVAPAGDYQVELQFSDGRSGIIDVSAMIPFTGVFEPLKDHEYFVRVRVDSESGSIVWPNGADLDPLVLYAAATGQPID